ncbi:putative ATP-dependent serine protease [Escherichia coli]|uniref:DNA repair protein RadA n=1 Tax=Escherichia coli TaxID=562 RepID=A0A485JK53_ECOLX|nr:putative ATP-dependent serine protease [Escherichia coli]
MFQSSPGSVAQVRETAAYLTRFAKTSGVAIVMVGHVTKDGSLAGPKVLEHCIDCSVLLDGDADSRFRTLRSHKNRFGAVNELGVFAMTEQGLREVSNPSAIFLSRGDEVTSGSSVMVVWEGTRPLLVEIQALVDHSMMANPRRVAVGLEQNRLAILLAVLHRHGGLQMADQDVFVNVVGGVKVTETSADLALLLAMVSSLRDRPLPQDLVVFGEVGLAGEIRPVPSGQERISEAAKHGFRRAIVPAANVPKKAPEGMQILALKNSPTRLACSTTYNERSEGDMSSFDYLKTAIKQQGCTLQQVADASGIPKGIKPVTECKIKAPGAKAGGVAPFFGAEFPRQKKTIGVVFVSSTRCIPDISTLSSAPVARLTSCISLWALTIPVTALFEDTPCRSSPPCRIVCAGYCKPLNIRKISVFMLSTKRAWSRIRTAGMLEQRNQKVYG